MQEELNEKRCEGVKKRKKLGEIGYAVILLVSVLLSILLTFSLTVRYFFGGTAKNEDFYRKFEVLAEYIDKNAYFDADAEKMKDAALKAFVSNAGDRYTVYYNAEDFKALNEDNEGRYVGIGVTVTTSAVVYDGAALELIEVVAIHENSPAEEAGLKLGDFIYSVDTPEGEVLADDVGLDVISSKIKGKEGSNVTITILREIDDEFQKQKVTLELRNVEIKSVSYDVYKDCADVGIVTVSQFDLNTPSLLSQAVDSLVDQGVDKIVVDLRDNGGGDLNSVIACASYFLDEGDLIMSAENNKGDLLKYKTRARTYGGSYALCSVTKSDIGKYKSLKTVILVNENTASAAELLTAVFRDYDLAQVVGVKTFGKGTMQTIYSLDAYGIDGGIKITTDVYFPPCGESYDGVGILPDVVVESGDGVEDLQLNTAIEILISK